MTVTGKGHKTRTIPIMDKTGRHLDHYASVFHPGKAAPESLLFYTPRSGRPQPMSQDNVTFLLNAIDTLSGDVGLVDLRGRKSKYRRIDRVDEMTKEASARRNEEIKAASTKAEADIKEAQAALDAAVKKINDDASLDETTKAVLLKSAEEAENRRLNAKREKIQRDKVRAIERTQTEHLAAVRQVEDKIRGLAVLVPPIPAILLGGFIFLRKRRREQDAIPSSRKRGSR